MKYLISIFFAASILVGCSGSDKIEQAESNYLVEETNVNPKEKALEHFLNGNVADQEGDYITAIQEYQKALRYDTSGGIFYSLAKSYLSANKLSNAIVNARLAVKYEPYELEYRNLMADIFIIARQNDSAAVVLEKMIEMDSTDVKTYYKLARVYENERPQEAIRIYNKLMNIIGPDWNVLIRVAELYEKLGYNDEAAEALNKLLAIDPSNLSLQKLIIDFYQRTGKYDEALIMVNDIIELIPDNLDIRQKKAQILIQKGDWKAAADEFNYILKQENVPLETKIGIGATYFTKAVEDSSILPIAKEIFETIDKDTTDWQVKLYLGAIAISEKDDSTAIKNFKYVTENARFNVQAWVRLGGLYFDNQKYEEAEKLMTEAIEIFPNDFAVNLILGLSLAQNNKPEVAEPYLKKAVNMNSSDITALSAYAFTLSRLGREEDAVDYLKKALLLQPDDVNLLGQLGLSYNNLKRWEESDSAYERALELDSTNALINNNYAYSLSERGLQLDRALRMVTFALKEDSLNSSYLDTKGWIYFKLGEYDKAQEFIQKAIDAGGENAVMLEHLGDILFMKGEQSKAVEIWKKALELDSDNTSLIHKVETGVI